MNGDAISLLGRLRGIPKWLRWTFTVILGLPTLGASIFGFYNMGVEAGAWGRRIGETDRVAVKLNEQWIGVDPPLGGISLPVSAGGCDQQTDCATIGVYEADKVSCSFRWIDDNGDRNQVIAWLVKDPAQVLGTVEVSWLFGSVAYAADKAEKRKIVKRKRLGKAEDGAILMAWIYEDFCYDVRAIDPVTGRVIPNHPEASVVPTCPSE